MKHIKKKFLLESKKGSIDFSQPGFYEVDLTNGVDNSELTKNKKSAAFLETDNGHIYGGFVHKVNGKHFVFPVPDPTLIYFNNAQLSVARITATKAKLLESIDFDKSLGEPALNEIYNFYGTTSGFVIFLFTAIESFINQQIPDGFVFENQLSKKTELYNKQQIQEYLDFKTKVTSVLKEISGKDFFQKQTPSNQLIWNLKKFRDAIIHTKPNATILQYDDLIKTSLNFNYNKALEAVALFMNFYKPKYIIECDCGKDF
jgi:hypothetical protein